MSKCRGPPFFIQKIKFEILDKKEDFTNDRWEKIHLCQR